MSDAPNMFAPVEPALLVATFSQHRVLVERNEAWFLVFGDGPLVWYRLSSEDQTLVAQCLADALSGSLVTNQIFPVLVPERDEPLPVLLNFLPVHLPAEDRGTRIDAVTVTGEVLAEPTSWMTSQTQRHRLEAVGRMTMGITHDFNNLLSGILGYTELLKAFEVTENKRPDHLEALSPDALQTAYADHLRTIERAALDGAALIKKLQRYIRQEKQIRFEAMDLALLAEDSVALTKPYWYNEPRRQGIGIELVTEISPVPPVLGSPTELREVVVNLILNAVQAMPGGGQLTIRVFSDPMRGVCLSVKDTGMGMSEAVKKRIFEPLFTTKGERGTGMGLAVCYGIIQEHDGTIDVISELGQGTLFEITLPHAEEIAPIEEIAPETVHTVPAHVLIVDDERMVRTVLSKLLVLRGHTVESAESGKQGLALIQNTHFDIVFVDQAMPEMNGREFAKLLQQSNPSLPIVLLTGATDMVGPGENIACVLRKPFQIEEIDATIQQYIQVSPA